MTSETMTIRLTDEEKSRICEFAKQEGISASNFLRRSALKNVDNNSKCFSNISGSANMFAQFNQLGGDIGVVKDIEQLKANNPVANIDSLFGSMVFNETTMKERLPKETFSKLMATVKNGDVLDPCVADEVANAMKDWAIERGATHYTHWFEPLSGTTSEKHEAFIELSRDGNAITNFSGKELIRGESDASSFPSGGLRATFEARGYTAWDPTSYAFIKDEVLCIPTAFCSYNGDALDKKTPLLRSMDVLRTQVKRIMNQFGDDAKDVTITVGAEQEFFLIPEADYAEREDLVLTGRTLFGSAPCKGQELEEHYYGAIRPTVNNFMKELDKELWELGISAKTKHNEVAPAQHELAPVFTNANRGVDENLITMEKMLLLASKYKLKCLLHEKPFAGINGSGKHNNWSITADGKNLLDPGEKPMENLRFLVVLSAIIQAVDEYQELLRMSIASASNDHRLGANEAPPAIVSIYLGDELGLIVDALISDEEYESAARVAMDLHVDVLPQFLKDNTDRNRTSPFAFTGNKFEFRMPGSNVNLSDCNMILNTAVAKCMKDFADAMEGKSGTKFESSAINYIKDVLRDHKRIIFNGNGYSAKWEAEAKRRGLANNKTTADALPCFISDKSIELFSEMGVLSSSEVYSRYEVKLEKYNKLINIEARVMNRMVRRTYIPAITEYSTVIANNINTCKSALDDADVSTQELLLKQLLDGITKATTTLQKLDEERQKLLTFTTEQEKANHNAHVVIPIMDELRQCIDSVEAITDRKYWPVPSYNNMLFYI